MEVLADMTTEDETMVSRRECEILRAPIEATLDEIKTMLKKLDGRPSWSVLAMISFLSSAVFVLLTLVLSH